MHKAFVLDNAELVLPDRVAHGWLAVEGGFVREIGEGRAPESGIDMAGDFIVPGLVELHTDNLESHLKPRPKVNWPRRAAIVAYDFQLACSGITTVFDSLRIGSDADYAPDASEVPELIEEISEAERLGMLRIDHRTHLRCEICAHDVIDSAIAVMDKYQVDLISLMDHTPGARQFASIDAWKTYYGGKSGLPDDQLDALMARKRAAYAANYKTHREALVAIAQKRGVAIASHDDSTREHVDESIGDRVCVAEFPTTVEAARLSHQASIAVLMGAPNVVRGGSHSGNVAAETLAREGVLDILSSDYVPASLLMGAFGLAERIEGLSLAQAIRTVTLNPARACGLKDRGAIEAGQIADLVRVRLVGGHAAIREVYKDGNRVL